MATKTKLIVSIACALIVVAVSVVTVRHFARQPGVPSRAAPDTSRRQAGMPSARGTPSEREESICMVFSDLGQGRSGIAAKIIEAPAGAGLSSSDCSSDATLQAKGATVRLVPRMTAESGKTASLFLGSMEPSSDRVPHEGIRIEVQPWIAGKDIKYTGSVTRWTPATQPAGKGAKPGGGLNKPLSRTHAFSGDCKIGEPVLFTPNSNQWH